MRYLKLLISIILISQVIAPAVKGQDFTVDVIEGCTPLKVKYTFTGSATTFYWDFGNGTTSTLADPDTVTYLEPGIYSPNLIYDNNVALMITKPNLITVHRTASSQFNYSAPTASLLYFEFEHTGTLDAGVTYNFVWDIEEFGTRTGPYQEITFPRADTFTVSLTVTDEFGCTSISTEEVAILSKVYVPNVFSPGGDDAVDNFFIIRNSAGYPLRIKIYSRTGVLVYESEGITITWDGETASGDKLKTGVYFYVLEALDSDPQKRYTQSGFIHMFRNE